MQYSSLFTDIAHDILNYSNASMDQVGSAVMNIRAVPYCVQCLMYPVKGLESQIGDDWRLESSPGIKAILKNTVLEDQLFITGPFSMGPSFLSRSVLCSHPCEYAQLHIFIYEYHSVILGFYHDVFRLGQS